MEGSGPAGEAVSVLLRFLNAAFRSPQILETSHRDCKKGENDEDVVLLLHDFLPGDLHLLCFNE